MVGKDNLVRKLRIHAILLRLAEVEAERKERLILYRNSGSAFAKLKEADPFLLTRIPEYKKTWIDPNESVFNYLFSYV